MDRQLFSALSRAFLFSAITYSMPSEAATSTYTDRAEFESQLATLITDNYEDDDYAYRSSDSEISAVFNETRYSATGWPGINLIIAYYGDDHLYCAGCSGSFSLDFTQSSISRGRGVDGFGMDFFNYDGLRFDNFPYYAFVTFGDGTTANYKLNTTPPVGFNTQLFFGVTSDKQIASVHFGRPDGGTVKLGQFGIDNLTIGVIPEPASSALVFSALVGTLGSQANRKPRSRNVTPASHSPGVR